MAGTNPILVVAVSHNAPKSSVSKTPPNVMPIAFVSQKSRFRKCVMPAYASGVSNQPYIKPAVGPIKTAIPPRPPVNTGNPNAANASNMPIVMVAGRVGNNMATNMTPIFCKTIGTPKNPTVIGGANANPINTANNNPIRVNVFVCMTPPFLLLYFIKHTMFCLQLIKEFVHGLSL